MNREQENLNALLNELDWLNQIIERVIRTYFRQEEKEEDRADIVMPDLSEDQSVYAQTVRDWNLGIYERVALALTLAPHLRSEMLDVFFNHNELYNRGFTEFGGMIDKGFSGFLPTGQTLYFIITVNDPWARGAVMNVLDPENRLMREQVLELHRVEPEIPAWSGMLSMSDQWVRYFLTGEKVRPELSASFPAHRITTPLEWEDLILEYPVMEQVEEIHAWLKYGNRLMSEWGLAKKIMPGYRALFYGPPGTGKTLTASLLGKSSGRDVYRVDLSMIVSKYIGETEKNLSKVFDAASYKEWILFFDEADALFGKRTAAMTSNDRHANQQTGYLLQRIEDFPGVVILASNLKSNMDEAFTRRFQSMIHFTIPSPDERLQLWRNAFSGTCRLHPEIDLERLSEDYELAGGSIVNVLRYCALSAISRDDTRVTQEELMAGLRREFKKENKTISLHN